MRYVVAILAIAALIAVVVALVRRGRRQGPGTYQRKFDNTPSQDNSVIYPAVFLGSTDHGHHPSHGADCAPHSDSGASCSDGGGGADGGGSN